jgi:hypothetical protein
MRQDCRVCYEQFGFTKKIVNSLLADNGDDEDEDEEDEENEPKKEGDEEEEEEEPLWTTHGQDWKAVWEKSLDLL